MNQWFLVGQRESALQSAHLTVCSTLCIYVAMFCGLYAMGTGRSLDGSAFSCVLKLGGQRLKRCMPKVCRCLWKASHT